MVRLTSKMKGETIQNKLDDKSNTETLECISQIPSATFARPPCGGLSRHVLIQSIKHVLIFFNFLRGDHSSSCVICWILATTYSKGTAIKLAIAGALTESPGTSSPDRHFNPSPPPPRLSNGVAWRKETNRGETLELDTGPAKMRMLLFPQHPVKSASCDREPYTCPLQGSFALEIGPHGEKQCTKEPVQPHVRQVVKCKA